MSRAKIILDILTPRLTYFLNRQVTKSSVLLRIRPSRHPQLLRNMSVKVSPYGTWRSPVSSQIVSESSVRFQEIRVDETSDASDIVYWSELRFDEGGRYVVCSWKKGDETYKSWTPKEFNARTRVHEYGGGAFFVYGNAVYFSNFSDQRMYVQKSIESAPEPITPENCGWRYADGKFNQKHNLIYCIREDHSLVEKKEAKEAKNTVVAIDPKSQNQTILAEGADFYSCPRVSPDGKRIAWTQWNHPNMPWDSTQIYVADLTPSGNAVVQDTVKQVAGGEGISVMQSYWTPNNELLYISDITGWWNLYQMTEAGKDVNLLQRNEETGSPQWVFGNQNYVINPSGNGQIVTVTNGELGILDMKTRDYKKIDTGYTSHRMLNLTSDGTVYCEGGSPTKFPCILRINLETGKVDVLRESKTLTLESEYFSIPKAITWGTSNGETSHGYYYAPNNKDYKAPDNELPPLLVKAHGGPTSQTSNVLNLAIQYFTSRGFAVLDVNYRGSTGYGSEYRNRLRGNWGICDVDDCCEGAKSLAKQGLADSQRLCIDGGSAGGYTTLACLAFRDVFKAGASHYGVCDLEALAQDTHKFESRYLDTVVGPYSGEGKQIYKDRSPINSVNTLNCAMAFFQGDEDKIVPPNQAEMMYEAVKKKKLPTMFVLFKGEQHGFRKSENVQTALDGEFYFFAKVFKFEPADNHISLEIDNL